MKRPFLFPAFLGGALLISCSFALYLHHVQKNYFTKIMQIYQMYQTDLKVLEDDETFLKQYHKEFQNLINRGWLRTKSRLIAAESIHQCAETLHTVNFTFEPETVKEGESGYSFKTSKIIIEASALLDTIFYDFLEKILNNFPGILILRKFSVTRHDKNPYCIKGEIIYEWVSMGESQHEE